MQIGVIADDFTGASDIANTLAKGAEPEGGLATAQYSGVPTQDAPISIEAGVISLKSRTAPVTEAVAESLAALDWLSGQGCQQIIFKYCSTFDSTKEGNIGPVAEGLANALNAKKVVFCPAFPTTGRTIFQGHLFVHDKPLNESGLENHPLTPMVDSDLRRWLQYQTTEQVGHIPYATIAKGANAVAAYVNDATERFLVADAISDQDLLVLGKALADAPLITGGSGIALGLPRNLLKGRPESVRAAFSTHVVGPEAILAGSCSGATRGQVEIHEKDHPTYVIDVPKVMDGSVTSDTLVHFLLDHTDRAPLVYSSSSPEEVKAIQAKFGRDEVAARLDALFAQTACTLIERGVKRLVVAGGETSGAVAQAVTESLATEAMTIGTEIDPGVPVLTLGEDNGVALALKSGNFGAPDFFAKALRVMEGKA